MSLIINKFNNNIQAILLIGLSILWTSVGFSNAIGPHTKTFNPTGSQGDFVSVHSGKGTHSGQYHLGLFLDLATNTSPYFQPQDGSGDTDKPKASITQVNDYVIFADWIAGYSFTNQLSFWVYAPMVLHSHIKETQSIYGEFNSRGLAQLRIGPKYSFYQSEQANVAAILTLGLNTVRDNPYAGQGQTMSTSIEIAGDVTPLPGLMLGANTGLRVSQTGLSQSEYVSPYSHSFLYSSAGSYAFSDNIHVVAEFFGSTPLKKEMDKSDRHTTAFESLFGIKNHYNSSTTFHGGLGTEIRHGVSSADLRFYGGIQKSLGSYQPIRSQETEPISQNLVADISPDDLWISDLSMRDKADEVVIVQNIIFSLNSSRYEDPYSASQEIDKLKRSLESEGGFKTLMIEGHTCSIGNKQYNSKLSRERAARIKRTLVREHGIPAHKIKIAGYGERFPLESNRTEQGRRENRRVEFRIYR